MWGSTFSDFAKKAQELQDEAAKQASAVAERAAQQASTLSTMQAPDLFNLDSLNKPSGETISTDAKSAETLPPTTVSATDSNGSKPNDAKQQSNDVQTKAQDEKYEANAQSTESEQPNEEKDVNSAIKVGETTTTLESSATEEKKVEGTSAEPVESGELGEENGWGGDDDDLDLDDIDVDKDDDNANNNEASSDIAEAKQESEVSQEETKPPEAKSDNDGVVAAEVAVDKVPVEQQVEQQQQQPTETESTTPIQDVQETATTVQDQPLETSSNQPASQESTTLTQQQPAAADEEDTPEEVSLPNAARVAADTIESAVEETSKTENKQQQEPGSMEKSDNGGAQSVPDDVLQKFALQMQRMQENFNMERQEMEKEHRMALKKVVQEAESRQQEAHMVLKEEIEKKDKQLFKLLRKNEGNGLKLDSLKREFEGTQKLLQERDTELAKAKEDLSKEMKVKDDKISSLEKEQAQGTKEIKSLKEELETLKGSLGTSNDEYSALKKRVMVVATELKERRVEVRDLQATIGSMQEEKQTLLAQKTDLQAQLLDKDRSRSEKDEQAEGLRVQITVLKQDLEASEKRVAEKEAAGEKALANYKRKAQNSLAVANARAAAAIDAKEEAETEAANVQSAADAAIQRSRSTEVAGVQAMEEAKKTVAKMQQDVDTALKNLATSEEALASAKTEIETLIQARETLQSQLTMATSQNENAARNLEEEKSKTSLVQIELKEARFQASELHDDVALLRDQLRRAKLQVASLKATTVDDDSGAEDKKSSLQPVIMSDASDVVMLQHELQNANKTIQELKEALKAAVDSDRDASNNALAMNGFSLGQFQRGDSMQSNGGSDSTPLLYAFEKRAELTTARNEINRLANLLGDAQSEKMEAVDALEEMKRLLEEERSKLQRHEKLSSASTPRKDPGTTRSDGIGNYNIEYLKNVMLSFLNAKTIAERKALVPVIGAVLCLTAEEQNKAIENVQAAVGIESVSNALFESFGSTFLK